MTTTVEFATGDGLVTYQITDGDLSEVKPEHVAQVRSALSLDLEAPAAAPADDAGDDESAAPETPPADDAAEDTTSSTRRGRGRARE
jgi:hypothetical protein